VRDSLPGRSSSRCNSSGFLSGFCKTYFFREKVQNMNELLDRIIGAVECITNEMLSSTSPETEYLLVVCRATNGTHIELH
jgi:hypothetical protein